MPLSLNELIKKAKNKRIETSSKQQPSVEIIRSWQHESTLFVQQDNKLSAKDKPFDDKQTTNRQQIVSKPLANCENNHSKKIGSVSKPLAKALAEPLANPSSSSSYNIYKTTTTGEEAAHGFLSAGRGAMMEEGKTGERNERRELGEWEAVDTEPLLHIGFTKSHLFQIASQSRLSLQAVQDSIYAFAFDLRENDRLKTIKGDPINFFMGILRNGKPYAPPSNYESPQDAAMRVYLEKMREIDQKRVKAEEEAMSLSFNDWFSKLSDDEKKEMLPETMRRTARLEKNKILEGIAKGRFEAEIWPEKRKEITETTRKQQSQEAED